MPRYSVGLQSTITAAGSPIATFKAGSTRIMRITRFDLSLVTAVASDIGIARSATATTAPTTVLGQAEDQRDPAALGGGAIAWTTAGTANAISLARYMFPATIGAAWSIPISLVYPLVIALPAATTELMIVNRGAGASGTFNITLEWDE